MRIATWNLERGRSRAARAAQEETLKALGADVLVLTEPGAAYIAGPGVVASPPTRPGSSYGPESWVAIVGPGVEPVPFDIPYERMAVAARVPFGGRSMIIYGAVLPWLSIRGHAKELVREGEVFADVFGRVLGAQKADIVKLKKNCELVVWAGDFNQTVGGTNAGGSRKGREALVNCLADLGLVAWNASADHAVGGLQAIDLICGPTELAVRAQGRIDPVRDGVRMSDHAGYWVDVEA
jgi:hypothetical protein